MTTVQQPPAPGQTAPQDPITDYARHLFLFNEVVKMVVEERLYLDTHRPPTFNTDVHIQVLLDSAMASVHQMSLDRAQTIFTQPPTNAVQHSIRYAAALTIAERLAMQLKIPPGHFAMCFVFEMMKRTRVAAAAPVPSASS